MLLQTTDCKWHLGSSPPVGEDGQLDGVTSDAPGLLLLLLVTILLLLQRLLRLVLLLCGLLTAVDADIALCSDGCHPARLDEYRTAYGQQHRYIKCVEVICRLQNLGLEAHV